jgi:hypothetical protein
MAWWMAIPAILQGASAIAGSQKKQPVPMVQAGQVSQPQRSGMTTSEGIGLATGMGNAAMSAFSGDKTETPSAPEAAAETSAMSRRFSTQQNTELVQIVNARKNLDSLPPEVAAAYKPTLDEAYKRALTRQQQGGTYA